MDLATLYFFGILKGVSSHFGGLCIWGDWVMRSDSVFAKLDYASRCAMISVFLLLNYVWPYNLSSWRELEHVKTLS